MNKWFWFWILVVVSGFAILRYALSFDLYEMSDASREFEVMRVMMEKGAWVRQNENLLISALFTTYFPAMIALHLHLNPEMVYRIFPLLFIVWIPALVYLVSRKYTNNYIAFIVAIIFLSQNYYLNASSFARIGIAMMFFSLAVLIILNNWKLSKALPLLSLCAFGVVLAHYGVTVVSVAFFGLWLVIRWILKAVKKKDMKQPNLSYIKGFLIPIVVFMVVWHGVILKDPLETMVYVLHSSINEITTPIERSEVSGVPDTRILPDKTILGINPEIFSLDKRELVVKIAFGDTFRTLNLAQRIEFVVSWLIIAVLTIGMYVMLKTNIAVGIATLASYLLMFAAVASPFTGQAYSVVRIYYQLGIFLMVSLGMGIIYLSKKVKIPDYALGSMLMIPYVLARTGMLNSWLDR